MLWCPLLNIEIYLKKKQNCVYLCVFVFVWDVCLSLCVCVHASVYVSFV